MALKDWKKEYFNKSKEKAIYSKADRQVTVYWSGSGYSVVIEKGEYLETELKSIVYPKFSKALAFAKSYMRSH